MRYISDDGKVFNTEQECCEYERQEKKRLEEEKLEKERREKERKKRLDSIKKHHNELLEEIESYEKEYNVTIVSGFYKTDFERMVHDAMNGFY